ncbi:UDP-glycosyltransferase 91C1 [Senna tora]|uniref:UDP-glycosyltransferase 91C1 n=1 Tax=Senna tora TaxID=362788 RepID=A0A834X1G3_9FABA|nr:UDP-glycosyltransferase 91C1 [Senna tora]
MVASAPFGNSPFGNSGIGKLTRVMREATSEGTLGSLSMFLGVDTRETWTPPDLAKAMERWKNGIIWPKADHGSITTLTTSCVAIFLLLLSLLYFWPLLLLCASSVGACTTDGLMPLLMSTSMLSDLPCPVGRAFPRPAGRPFPRLVGRPLPRLAGACSNGACTTGGLVPLFMSSSMLLNLLSAMVPPLPRPDDCAFPRLEGSLADCNASTSSSWLGFSSSNRLGFSLSRWIISCCLKCMLYRCLFSSAVLPPLPRLAGWDFPRTDDLGACSMDACTADGLMPLFMSASELSYVPITMLTPFPRPAGRAFPSLPRSALMSSA